MPVSPGLGLRIENVAGTNIFKSQCTVAIAHRCQVYSRALWRPQGVSIDLAASNDENMLNPPISFKFLEVVHRRCDALRDMGPLQSTLGYLLDTADQSGFSASHSHESSGVRDKYPKSSYG